MIKKILIVAGVLVLVFFAFGAYIGSTPDGQARIHERAVIEQCWKMQGKKSLEPDAARLAAGACEKMEDDYRAKWNRDP